MTCSTQLRCIASVLSFSCGLLSGCSDDAAFDDVTDGSTGLAEDGTPSGDSSSSSGVEGPGEGAIEGRILWIDGTQTELDLDASYERFDLGDRVQHQCGGTELAEGLTLGILWYEGTTAGTYPISLADGPMVLAAWPQVDGSGVRATLPGQGEVTFARLGTEPGDVIEGTASAVLTPEDDDPDDRVREIVDIAFHCVVPE